MRTSVGWLALAAACHLSAFEQPPQRPTIGQPTETVTPTPTETETPTPTPTSTSTIDLITNDTTLGDYWGIDPGDVSANPPTESVRQRVASSTPITINEVEVCLEERTDGSDVLPVAGEQVRLDVERLGVDPVDAQRAAQPLRGRARRLLVR